MIYEEPHRVACRRRKLEWAAWLLVSLCALLPLRNSGPYHPVDTDAARHAMNGAFVHDLIATGSWLQPLDFGHSYYSRLPAVSIPYHPPLFPAVEAAAYALFGVSGTTARLLVALFYFAGILLFYLLIVRTTGSRLAGVCTIATFCFWRISQSVSTDVMLEFPSFLLIVAALYVIQDMDKGLTVSRGLLFGLLAAAALWTKQHALFLAGVPVAAILLNRRYRMLTGAGTWAALALFVCSAGALAMLSIPLKSTGITEISQVAEPEWFEEVPLHHIRFYPKVFPRVVGSAAFVLIAAAPLLWLLFMRGRNSGLWLYSAWAVSAGGLLLVLGPYDERYLFYLYPPLLVIAYVTLIRVSAARLPANFWWAPAVLIACLSIVPGLGRPRTFLNGPADAAAQLVDGRERRIVYCGSTDGNFVFAVRSLDPTLRTTVIRGEPLLAKAASPAVFAKQVERYGVSAVVIENTSRQQPCNALWDATFAAVKRTDNVKMSSSTPRFDGGTLSIFEFEDAPDRTKEDVQVIVPKLGVQLDLKF